MRIADNQGAVTTAVAAPVPVSTKWLAGKKLSFSQPAARQISTERVALLRQQLRAHSQALQTVQSSSPAWVNVANDYFGSINALRTEKSLLQQDRQTIAAARQITPADDHEQRQLMNEQDQWLTQQNKAIDEALQQGMLSDGAMPKGGRDPDLIHPGEQVVTGFKPTVPHIVTATEVKMAIRQEIDQAKQLATLNTAQTINDPLLKQAQQDPVSYATNKVLQAHANEADGVWQQAVTQNQASVRQDYTRAEVSAAWGRGDAKAAIGIVTSNLNHTQNQAERDALYQASRDLFDAPRFEKIIDQVPTSQRISSMSPNTHAENVGQWLQDVTTDGIAPEVANTLLTVVDKKIMQPWDDHNGGVGPRLYGGLSRLVQAHDTPAYLGTKVTGKAARSAAAPKVAAWLDQRMNTSTLPQDLLVKEAVAKGDIKLSLALLDKLQGADDFEWREAVKYEMADGITQIYEDWQTAQKQSQDAARDLRFVIAHYVQPGDMNTANKLNLDFRSHFPDKAAALDAAQWRADQQSARLAGMLQDVTLYMAQAPQADLLGAGGRKLTAQLDQISGDKQVLPALQDSQALAQQLFWQNKGDDLSALSSWAKVGLSPYAKTVRGAKNLADFFVQQRYKVTMDQMLTDFGVDPKLDGKFADRIDKISTQLSTIACNAGVDAARIAEIDQIMHTTATQIRGLTSSNTQQNERDIIKLFEKNMKTLLGDDMYVPALKKWNPTDNRLALGKALRITTFAAYGVSLHETMNKIGLNPNWQDQVSAGAYAGSLGISGTELYAGFRGINPAKDWTFWGKYIDRASPIVSAVPDAMNGVKDWQSGDYVGAGLDAGIVAANGAGFIAKLPIAAGFGAAFGPYAPLVIGVVSIARAAWSVTYEHVKTANRFEYNDNPVTTALVKDLGFTDAQAKQLLNQTGSGVSPMVALNQLAAQQGWSQPRLMAYLQRLQPQEIAALVAETHYLIDAHLDDKTGKLPTTDARADVAGQVTYDVDSTDVVPNVTPHNLPYYDRPADPAEARYYVNRAESLQGLAHWLTVNQLDAAKVNQRQPLAIAHLPQLVPKASPVTPLARDKPEVKWHTVQPGETLWGIAGGNRADLNRLYALNTGQFDARQEDHHDA